MKKEMVKSALVFAMLFCGLAACGGGGDDASGAPGELSLTPSELAFEFGGTNCTSSATFPGTVNVLINGGAGDYSVATTAPTAINLGPVVRVNGVYQFSFTMNSAVGTCFPDPGVTIQVTDVRKNFTVLKLVTSASAP